MKRLALAAACWLLTFGAVNTAQAVTLQAGATIAVQDLTLTVPTGWNLQQNAKDAGTIILGFANGSEYLSLFAKAATGMDMHSIFANDVKIVRDIHPMSANGLNWQILETSKSFPAHHKTYYVSSFMMEKSGVTYYGYSRASTAQQAAANVAAFIGEIKQ